MGNSLQKPKSEVHSDACRNENDIITSVSVADDLEDNNNASATFYNAECMKPLPREDATGGDNTLALKLSNFRDMIDPKKMDKDTKERVKAGLFLGTLTGLSMLSGFGMTLAVSKRQDPNNFAKGLSGSREIPESGISLASRALARGTLCSVVGVGAICFAVWKILGVHSLTEFRYKVGSMMPTIPKKENPGRGDFRTIRDLFQFIIDEDEREKQEGKSAKPP